jgi:cyclomaltodextrinase / maltogenic alpha-amylase / neopullulanase
MSDSVTQDFIFGTLATDELRLEALRQAERGLVHANRTDPPDPLPNQPVELLVNAGAETDADEVFAVYTTDGTDPADAGQPVPFQRADAGWNTLTWGYRQDWRGIIPPQPDGTLVRYRIGARYLGGPVTWADPDPWTGTPTLFAYHVDRFGVPDWVRDAVIYHVFVDRFAPGAGRGWANPPTLSDVWGGTLRGVIEKLPYLADLGVTCLWLSPIFPSPTHHGYDATDYHSIEPRLGTTDDFVELCEAAHARGIRVLLDFVASHVSDRHPVFQHALNDPNAPVRAWFTFDDAGRYRSFFGVASMPQVAVDHPAARDYLCEAAAHWLKLGADGFRLDYANGPSHAFWAAFRAATRAAKADSFCAGEIVETAELQRSYQGRLDGALDFLLLQQVRAFFAFQTIDATAFDRFLSRHLAFFPPDFLLPTFLDNHDMNRFLWVCRGDKRLLRLAALCQFTLPPPPIVYYGTEVGLSQRRDLEYPDGSRRPEESRTLMPWGADQDTDLLGFYRALIGLRRNHPALWRGRRTTLAADTAGLYVVSIEAGGERAIVALNRGPEPRDVPVPASSEVTLATDRSATTVHGHLQLGPYTGAVAIADGS